MTSPTRGSRISSRCADLRWLILGEADQITDEGLQTLGKLKRLKVLRMDLARHMTPAGIEELKDSLPNCEIEIRGNPDEPLDTASLKVRPDP